jgi:hypothetical protein
MRREHLKPRLAALYALEERVGVASRRILTERDAALAELRGCAHEAEMMRDGSVALVNRTIESR